jgi:hypothetical protein
VSEEPERRLRPWTGIRAAFQDNLKGRPDAGNWPEVEASPPPRRPVPGERLPPPAMKLGGGNRPIVLKKDFEGMALFVSIAAYSAFAIDFFNTIDPERTSTGFSIRRFERSPIAIR